MVIESPGRLLGQLMKIAPLFSYHNRFLPPSGYYRRIRFQEEFRLINVTQSTPVLSNFCDFCFSVR